MPCQKVFPKALENEDVALRQYAIRTSRNFIEASMNRWVTKLLLSREKLLMLLSGEEHANRLEEKCLLFWWVRKSLAGNKEFCWK